MNGFCKRSSCQSAGFDRLPQFCHLIVGVRLSAKHSGKQMSNPYLISMRVVKWSFNLRVGLAHGSPGVHGCWECERSESRGPALGAGNATLEFCRTHNLLAHAEKERDECEVQGLGRKDGCKRPHPTTALLHPTACLPRLWLLCRSWSAEADRQSSPDFFPLVSLWALPQAPGPLPSELGLPR